VRNLGENRWFLAGCWLWRHHGYTRDDDDSDNDGDDHSSVVCVDDIKTSADDDSVDDYSVDDDSVDDDGSDDKRLEWSWS